MVYEITAEQQEFFDQKGYLILRDVLSGPEVTDLQRWAQEVHDLPAQAPLSYNSFLSTARVNLIEHRPAPKRRAMGSAFPLAFEGYESLGPHSREEGHWEWMCGRGRRVQGPLTWEGDLHYLEVYGTQPVDATSFTTCPVILGYMSSQAEMSKFRLEDVCLPAPLPDLGLALIK
jgi:hypothetical protein